MRQIYKIPTRSTLVSDAAINLPERIIRAIITSVILGVLYRRSKGEGRELQTAPKDHFLPAFKQERFMTLTSSDVTVIALLGMKVNRWHMKPIESCNVLVQ